MIIVDKVTDKRMQCESCGSTNQILVFGFGQGIADIKNAPTRIWLCPDCIGDMMAEALIKNNGGNYHE